MTSADAAITDRALAIMYDKRVPFSQAARIAMSELPDEARAYAGQRVGTVDAATELDHLAREAMTGGMTYAEAVRGALKASDALAARWSVGGHESAPRAPLASQWGISGKNGQRLAK